MNYYELLGITKDASCEDVRKSYLELAKKYHPDVNNAKNANFLFSQIKDAYDTLSNPVSRNAYDSRMGYSNYGVHNSSESHSTKSNDTSNSQDSQDSFIELIIIIILIVALFYVYLFM